MRRNLAAPYLAGTLWKRTSDQFQFWLRVPETGCTTMLRV